MQLEELKNAENYSFLSASVYDDIRKTAQIIYDEYLSEKVSPKIYYHAGR